METDERVSRASTGWRGLLRLSPAVTTSSPDARVDSEPLRASGQARKWWRATRPTLGLLGAWGLLDTMVNLRFPGEEPGHLWCLIPSIDVLVVFVYLALFGWVKWRIPAPLRVALVAFLFVVRVIRVGDGVMSRYYLQPFNLYIDLPLVPELVRFSFSSLPVWKFSLLAAGALVGLGVLAVANYRALQVVETYLSTARGVTIAAGIAAASFLYVLIAKHDPQFDELYFTGFAQTAVRRVKFEAKFLLNLRGYRSDRENVIARAEERLAHTPSNLAKLHGANVYLFLVESYGETVAQRPYYADRAREIYGALEADLGASGYTIASSLLDSPTYGGRSWLAHATLATALRTEDQLQYEFVCASKRKTIATFFHDAGYRTVLVQPGTTREWPQGEFYGFDQKYYSWNFDYVGPSFGWATMPDQYVLDFIRRRVIPPAPEEHPTPLFIDYVLVSSHAPWHEQAEMVDDWSRLGNGTIYKWLDPVRYPIKWPDLSNASEAYIRSIVYDLEVLKRYLAEFVRDDALVIILGDHQPVAEVNGDSHSHGVPIHVMSRDPSFIEPFVARGYARGMWPEKSWPHPDMDTFLVDLLSDLSTADPVKEN